MKVTDKYVFFWGGIFSNFYEVNGPCLDPKESNTSEQIFMMLKAITFDDYESVIKISEADSPMACKRLGRKVRGFKQQIWDECKEEMMMRALRWKAKYCKEFCKKLRETGEKTLVEASPDDRIWGIGYDENEALSNVDDWGENLLGKCLMKIREDLK